METKWKTRLWRIFKIECVTYKFGDPAKRKLYIKKTNNHIYALMGVTLGLKGICVQMWGFSVWSKFQNEHANELS